MFGTEKHKRDKKTTFRTKCKMTTGQKTWVRMDNHVGKQGVRERAGREGPNLEHVGGRRVGGQNFALFFSSDRLFVLFLHQRPPRFHKMSREPKCVLLFNDADSHRPTAIQRKTSEIGKKTKRGSEEEQKRDISEAAEGVRQGGVQRSGDRFRPKSLQASAA